MKNKMSINILLCENYNEKNSSIEKIFNNIKLNNNNNTISFNLTTFISIIFHEKSTEFFLLYQIVDVNRGLSSIIDVIEFDISLRRDVLKRRPFLISDTYIENRTYEKVNLNGSGEYKVLVHAIEKKEDDNILNLSNEEIIVILDKMDPECVFNLSVT